MISRQSSITALRLTLGAVVLIESVLFLMHESGRSPAHGDIPIVVRVVLGGAEVLGAILFLVPPAAVLGGWLLLAVFCAAILLHLLHGQWEVGALIVYAAAVLAVISNRDLSGSLIREQHDER
jgi:hypothetical protein